MLGSYSSLLTVTLTLFLVSSTIFFVPTVDAGLASRVPPSFIEVTEAVGLGTTESDKTTAPCVGDLDGNGFMDIVMSNHARGPFEVFMGSESGYNRSVIFRQKSDRHGAGIGDYNGDGRPDIVLAVAGGTKAFMPSQPVIGEVAEDGTIRRVEGSDVGLNQRKIRGVGIRMVDIDGDGDLDMFIHGRKIPSRQSRRHGVYENTGGGQFRLQPSVDLEFGPSGVGYLCTDYDGDGNPDFFIYATDIQVFKGDGNFGFAKVTDQFFKGMNSRGLFTGAAQLDYDNDGDMDLFFAGGYRDKGPYREGANRLFENRGRGVFVDVSDIANVGRGASPGATVGDFNNDGFMDIFLPSAGPTDFRTPTSDSILLNSGNKTFERVRNHGANGPTERGWASGAQAFDYNNDGNMDVVVGARLPNVETALIRGRMRLFENTTPNPGNYFTVGLPVMSDLGETTMDAIVTLRLSGGRKLTRIAGSVGDHRSHSFINNVHFGLDDNRRVRAIRVKLTTGRRVVVKLRGTVGLANQRYQMDLSTPTAEPTAKVPTILAQASPVLEESTSPVPTILAQASPVLEESTSPVPTILAQASPVSEGSTGPVPTTLAPQASLVLEESTAPAPATLAPDGPTASEAPKSPVTSESTGLTLTTLPVDEPLEPTPTPSQLG